jgi:hypothetical protein
VVKQILSTHGIHPDPMERNLNYGFMIYLEKMVLLSAKAKLSLSGKYAIEARSDHRFKMPVWKNDFQPAKGCDLMR